MQLLIIICQYGLTLYKQVRLDGVTYVAIRFMMLHGDGHTGAKPSWTSGST